MNKILLILLILLFSVTLTACKKPTDNTKPTYQLITPESAKIMMEDSSVVILDVRTPEEYKEGHIEGSILIPDYEILETAEKILTDKNQTILVYCRSGNRSKQASEKLVNLGYTDVIEIGGIMDYTGELEY